MPTSNLQGEQQGSARRHKPPASTSRKAINQGPNRTASKEAKSRGTTTRGRPRKT